MMNDLLDFIPEKTKLVHNTIKEPVSKRSIQAIANMSINAFVNRYYESSLKTYKTLVENFPLEKKETLLKMRGKKERI